MILRFIFALFITSLVSPVVQAHTLGIDKAVLTEMVDGSYRLVSRVPPRYQSMITTLELPPRCTLDGSPRGARGDYEVRFEFNCESTLTADDIINLPWRREGVMLTVAWQDQSRRHGQ